MEVEVTKASNIEMQKSWKQRKCFQVNKKLSVPLRPLLTFKQLLAEREGKEDYPQPSEDKAASEPSRFTGRTPEPENKNSVSAALS